MENTIKEYTYTLDDRFNSLKNIIGVYAIINTTNNKLYIGASGDLYARFREHKSKLKRGIHHNALLNIDFDNGDTLILQVLEIFQTKSDIHNIERQYIKKYSENNELYNMWNNL